MILDLPRLLRSSPGSTVLYVVIRLRSGNPKFSTFRLSLDDFCQKEDSNCGFVQLNLFFQATVENNWTFFKKTVSFYTFWTPVDFNIQYTSKLNNIFHFQCKWIKQDWLWPIVQIIFDIWTAKMYVCLPNMSIYHFWVGLVNFTVRMV